LQLGTQAAVDHLGVEPLRDRQLLLGGAIHPAPGTLAHLVGVHFCAGLRDQLLSVVDLYRALGGGWE
jgi:hypothetical protein